MKHLIVSSILILYLTAPAISASEIKIAAIDWCPYICQLDSDSPGILVEYVQLAYQNTGIKTTFSIYPWSRAIKEVEQGKQTALLAPAKNEAPQLVFPTAAIGQQRFCFFTLTSDDWHYSKPQDLFGRVSIYPANALPEELLVLVDHTDTLISNSYTANFSEKNTQLLIQGYLDAVLITDYSMKYYLSKSGLQAKVKSAGCTKATALYLAFTPEMKQRESVRVFIHFLEAALTKPETRNKMASLTAKYGI